MFKCKFSENNNAQIESSSAQNFKRETQSFGKASYSFNGFEKTESIPVLFPFDICIMNVDGVKYATSLHMNKDGVRHFAVHKMNNGSYEQLADIPTPKAIAMDCKSAGAKGYIALAYNLSEPIENAKDGSPIIQIAGDRLRAVQYFAAQNLVSVYLRGYGDDLFLLQTFANTKITPHLHCPYFKWSGSTFTKLGRIPCSNARHLEPFAIDYESYVAVANYADQRGRTETYSEIYKFEREKGIFALFQKIRTNGAVDARYFSVPYDGERRQHFLVFGNSISTEDSTTFKSKNRKREGKNLEADSVFYVFERGQFVPYQRLTFYAVEQFLPVQNLDPEKFLLLVACTNQDTKIYNLNDWKFEESQAQFTEGALSRGVSNMRIYQENDSSYLVIANQLMAANETNIFLPIFKQEEHAYALRQQIIAWAKTNIERLAGVDVEKLKHDVERKLSRHLKDKQQLPISDIPSSNIQTVVTKSLVYPQLNLTDNYWKALSYANQALDVLESQYAPKQIRKRDVSDQKSSRETKEFEFEELSVGTLIVRDTLKAERVNGVEAASPHFESITAIKTIVTGRYDGQITLEKKDQLEISEVEDMDVAGISDVVNVENLQITGKLNGFTWHDLMNKTLKVSSPVQIMEAPAKINHIQAARVMQSHNKISGKNLSELVLTSGGDYIIDQNIQFAAPVSAKNVVINERLNNLHVLQGKFDNLLLKRSNETQIITGAKQLSNVKVLEPITIRGQMLGKQFESISPNKAVHENVILHGNFNITGDVTISKLLSANDILLGNAKISIRDTLQHGVRTDRIIEDVDLKFEAQLEANNSIVSFVNAKDVQNLIKTNTDAIQVVEGEKFFKQNLEIRKGSAEVKILNDINVEKLEPRLFLKHTNQIIRHTMHFGKIFARGFTASILQLSNKNISDFLKKSGDQQIQGLLKVNKLYAETLNVENLNTNGKIFNHHPSDIYQAKAKNSPNLDIFRKERKFHGSIYAKNLKLNTTINGKNVADIERQLMQMDGNIKYVGNLKFNYGMNITNLTFSGTFNGVPAADFGLCWLQRMGAQVFTSPQTFAGVTAKEGVILADKLNGYRMEDYFKKTYWLNHNEYIKDVVFQSPTQMQGALTSKTVNGIYIPQDVLFRSSIYPQVLNAHAVINHLFVNGNISNTTVVNGLNLPKLGSYLNGHDNSDTLHVENAYFTNAPHFNTLNNYDLKSTLDAVWLKNENVDLQQYVEISDGYFEGLVDFEGTINNVNLKHLQENYFSLTRSQDITTEYIFASEAEFKTGINTEEVHLFGPINESESNTSFNFNEYVLNTLKTAGPHKINGTWTLHKAIVQGDLHNVRINNLNMKNDVVRTGTPSNNVITAKKRIPLAAIEKLYATPASKVSGVGVANWIRDTIYVYENHTIQGTTTIDAVNVFNDLCVRGLVNNMTFNEETLLLRDRDQVIRGDVRVRNNFPEERRILVSNFENLQTKTVNGISVAEFFANRAKQSATAHVRSHLIFEQPLALHEYHGVEMEFVPQKWQRKRYSDAAEGPVINKTIELWQRLEADLKILRKSLEVPSYILDHFELCQTLRVNATTLISITISIDNEFLDIIGISNDADSEHLNYYRWDQKAQQFVLDEKLLLLPKNKHYADILRLVLRNMDYPNIDRSRETTPFNENIISNETKAILNGLLQQTSEKLLQIEGFQIQEQECFAVYNSGLPKIPILCLDSVQENSNFELYHKTSIARKNVKQVLAVSNTAIVLLYAGIVEIWTTSTETPEIEQRLPLVQDAKQMAVGFHKEATYLAIITESKENTSRHAIEIFCSSDSTKFTHLQTLEDRVHPLQVAFSAQPKQSDNLLLHILTATADHSLLVFEYKGVAGFQRIVGPSVLPLAEHMEVIELKSAKRHFIALFSRNEVSFIEIVLKKF